MQPNSTGYGQNDERRSDMKTSRFVVSLPERRRPQRRARVSVRVRRRRWRRRRGDQRSEPLRLASDVLLLGEGVGRRPGGRGRGQALRRGVFEDGGGVRRRREGVSGRGGAAAGGRGGVRVVGLLRQKGQRRVDGRRVGLRVVLLVARQPVAHVVGRVWQLLVEPPGVLQRRHRVRTSGSTVSRTILITGIHFMPFKTARDADLFTFSPLGGKVSIQRTR